MLDNRLRLAYDLYEECELAADIGTDHALLPAALLRSGRCSHMILTDISESALNHARMEMVRQNLTDRVSIRLGDGLLPLAEPCRMISVLGMGGRTIADILLSGQAKLQGAVLLLSAHTDLYRVRDAVMRIGYHLQSETPCLDRGRYYLLFKAVPGKEQLTESEVRFGKRLLESDSDQLLPYLQHRREVVAEKLTGLLKAGHPSEERVEQVRADLKEEDLRIRMVQIRQNPDGKTI